MSTDLNQYPFWIVNFLDDSKFEKAIEVLPAKWIKQIDDSFLASYPALPMNFESAVKTEENIMQLSDASANWPLYPISVLAFSRKYF